MDVAFRMDESKYHINGSAIVHSYSLLCASQDATIRIGWYSMSRGRFRSCAKIQPQHQLALMYELAHDANRPLTEPSLTCGWTSHGLFTVREMSPENVDTWNAKSSQQRPLVNIARLSRVHEPLNRNWMTPLYSADWFRADNELFKLAVGNMLSQLACRVEISVYKI